MKISLVCVGRPRSPLAEPISQYEGRILHYFPFEAVEVKESGRGGQPLARLLEEEGERLLARVPKRNELVALHRLGSRWSSESLAGHLAEGGLNGIAGISFLIGGAFGLSKQVLDRADHLISLSAMTLPHELARLVLAEQLYRAGTIMRGEPYHKGSHS